MTYRFDRTKIKIQHTDEGYIVDTPVLGRVGIQLYRNNDGSIRREFRPPEEVFHPDSLASFVGKPVTDLHPAEPVNAKNASLLTKGAIVGSAVPDETNVKAQIVVHDAAVVAKILQGSARELSLGYAVELDFTPGEWNGQKYDAIQRKIRVNHLAVVPSGRAGNAKFNIDAAELVTETTEATTVKLKLDNGLEYEVPAEVEVAFTQIKRDAAEAQAAKTEAVKRADTLMAERDIHKAEAGKIEQIKKDALEEAKKLIQARASLEKAAGEFNVDCASKTDRQIKEEVVKTVRADLAMDGKSDEYVNAAFDLAVSMKNDSAAVSQRTTVAGTTTQKTDASTGGATYEDFMANLGKKA